jgi:hypothetical protein
LRGGGWLDFGQFNWHDVAPGRAIRAALGVITPLAAGIAAGHAAYGSFAALGALPAGFVSFRGVSRTRVLAVAADALGDGRLDLRRRGDIRRAAMATAIAPPSGRHRPGPTLRPAPSSLPPTASWTP